MLVRMEFTFEWLMLLTLVAVLGVTQLVSWLRVFSSAAVNRILPQYSDATIYTRPWFPDIDRFFSGLRSSGFSFVSHFHNSTNCE
jgi:hypothetical protein